MSETKKSKHDRQYEEVNEYRDLLQAPNQFEEGFTIRTIIGVLFISLIMTPGEMYLGLVTGGGVGAAAQWVTVILFLEVAKRSFTSLRRQEIYLLVYVAGALIVREEGAFLDLLWKQYFVRSPEIEQFGLSGQLPYWWAPPPDSEAIAQRTFIHWDWAWPIGLLVMGTIMGRIGWFTSGYVLFRMTSDREKLPFPTAPMSALSAMALAEESGQEAETWKWPVFSIGTAIGASFGFIYVGIPAITEIVGGARVEIIPVPFWDLTPYLGNVLHATPMGISLHIGGILGGLLAPFWGIIGAFGGVILHMVASPILHSYGFLPRWELGMDTIRTQIVTGLDFWQAFSIGITLAVTFVSFYQMIATARHFREEKDAHEKVTNTIVQPQVCQHSSCNKPAEVRGLCLKHLGRGDFRIWACILLFCIPTIYTIVLAKYLFPHLVSTGLLLIFLILGFVYAPIMSVVSARLDGMIGRDVAIPYVHETIIYLTGFRGVEIWFVPFPGQNFGGNAEQFRIVELTGMRFTSLLKAELFMLPIVFAVSLMYWTFLWRLAPIPSETYPYAQLMWPLKAYNQALFFSSTMYNKTWTPGEEVDDGEIVQENQTVWSPSNLQNQMWWYWRVRVSDEVDIPDPEKRSYGAWSQIGYFYADFENSGLVPTSFPADFSKFNDVYAESYVKDLPKPQLLWPPLGETINTANPNFKAEIDWQKNSSTDSLVFYFEVDRLPTFDGEFLQRSSDMPLLFNSLWKDPRFTGDRKDNDNDRRINIMAAQVEDNGIAKNAGMQSGDRIHAINGRLIKIQDWEIRNKEPVLDTLMVQRVLAKAIDNGRDSLRVSYKRGKYLYHKQAAWTADISLDGKYKLTTVLPFMGDEEVIVDQVKKKGLWKSLDIKKGDLLQAVNGLALDTDDAERDQLEDFVFNTINSWRDSVYIEYERDGDLIGEKVANLGGQQFGLVVQAGQIVGVDEELHNLKDDDGDGLVDEDIRHPLKGWELFGQDLDGQKWPIILFGATFGIVGYFSLAIAGMPIFLIWGYVQGVNGIPHNMILPIIGALLARFYFWGRYGKQQWRQYAMVLGVGAGVGGSLIGMFCTALAMISKAVSSLSY